MKKLETIFNYVLILSGIALLGACGGGSSSSPVTPSTTSSTTSSPTSAVTCTGLCVRVSAE